jgi:hypothetical protein
VPTYTRRKRRKKSAAMPKFRAASGSHDSIQVLEDLMGSDLEDSSKNFLVRLVAREIAQK